MISFASHFLGVLARLAPGQRRRPATTRTGSRFGQYTLGEKIGEGGMSEVYLARHALLRRPTAIKLPAREVSEPELCRFEAEVQLTAQLRHPNTISIYDYGRAPDGTPYCAMELLDGVTLQDLVERHGTQSSARVIHILLQVCAALREAHGAGLIHRDVKPANLFLCRHGTLPDVVKVLDFGLVKQLGNAENDQTSADTIVGTPLYLAPEAITAPETVDARSDLYAVGAVGYFLLSGSPLFSGSTVEVCAHHLYSDPEPLSRGTGRSISEDLERVIMDCLAKDPARRPRNAEELAHRLRACAEAEAWGESDAERWWQASGKLLQPVLSGVA